MPGLRAEGPVHDGKERRITRWEHEAVLEAVQARLDRYPAKMRLRRQTVEHLGIPTIATTHSDGSRPPVPNNRDQQCGAGADGAVG